jgi:cellobiose transport system substrate-binding protein
VRKLLVLIGLSAAVCFASLTAGAAATSHSTSGCPNGVVTLTMWDFQGETEIPYVPKFEKTHPCIKVKVTVREYNTHHQALLTALAAGTPPDVAGIEIGNIAKFIANPNNFTNLYDLGARSIQKEYLPWEWNMAATPDRKEALGIPTAAAGLAIAFRSDYFKKAGLPTQRDAVAKLWPTWNAFVQTGIKYKKATGQAFIDSAGNVYDAVLGQGTTQYYDAQGKTIYATNPRVRTAWNVAMAVIKNGLSKRLAPFTNEWTTGIGKGEFGVMVAPSWMQTVIKPAAPKDAGKWDITALPGVYGNLGGSWLTIPAKSKHQKEAYQLITWLNSPATQLDAFKTQGALPATNSIYKSPVIQNVKAPYFSNAPIGKIYTRSVVGLKAPPLGKDQNAIETEFQNGIARVEQGKQTAAQAWVSTLKNIKLQIGS